MQVDNSWAWRSWSLKKLNSYPQPLFSPRLYSMWLVQTGTWSRGQSQLSWLFSGSCCLPCSLLSGSWAPYLMVAVAKGTPSLHTPCTGSSWDWADFLYSRRFGAVFWICGKVLLITQYFCCCSTVLTQCQGCLCFFSSPQWVGWRWVRGWERTQLGHSWPQLT